MGFTKMKLLILFLPFTILVRSELIVKEEIGEQSLPISLAVDSRGFENTTYSLCGYTLTCGTGTIFYKPDKKMKKNFRCSFLISSENSTFYEVDIVNNFTLDNAGILINAFSLDTDVVSHTNVNHAGPISIKGHAIMVTIYTNNNFHYPGLFEEPIIIDYKGIRRMDENPVSDYSTVQMIMPETKYRHPLEQKSYNELPAKRELSLVGFLPKENHLSDDTDTTRFYSVTYKRTHPSTDINCQFQKIMVYLFFLLKTPQLSYHMRICGNQGVSSFDFTDLALVAIKSYRDKDDPHRSFELEYRQAP